MKLRYKNKRDFYKAEAERLQGDLVRKQLVLDSISKQLEEAMKPKPKERINVAWFCTQCRVVEKGTVPVGTNIENCSCLNCGASKLLAVGKLPFGF